MKNGLSLIDALIYGGDFVGTKDFQSSIKFLIKEAKKADGFLRDIEMEDVFDMECTDILAKLQRNSLALITLLSMSLDAAVNVRTGIYKILNAHTEMEKLEQERRLEAIERNKNYELRKEQNKRYRDKKAQAE